MHSAPDSSPLQNSPGEAHAPSHAAGNGGGAASSLLMVRVGRVLHDLCANRAVPDADLLQHRQDCRQLMEEAAERWQHGCESRETVERWQACFLEACNRLSPQWKAAREAENLQAAAAGPGGSGCYFMDEGDRARAALAGRPAA